MKEKLWMRLSFLSAIILSLTALTSPVSKRFDSEVQNELALETKTPNKRQRKIAATILIGYALLMLVTILVLVAFSYFGILHPASWHFGFGHHRAR